MLILTRKENQTVTIIAGDQTIRVVVTQLRDGSVRLGFDADRSVQVFRSELVGENHATSNRNDAAAPVGERAANQFGDASTMLMATGTAPPAVG